jgi:Tol biopolymer transport system component
MTKRRRRDADGGDAARRQRPPRAIGQREPESPYGSFSPDGQWIAFVAREGDARRLFVQRKTGQGTRVAVTAASGTYPRWRSDGRELYYLSASTGNPDMMMARDLDGERSGFRHAAETLHHHAVRER